MENPSRKSHLPRESAQFSPEKRKRAVTMVLIDSVVGKQSRVACHAAFLSTKMWERERRSNSRDFPTKNTHTRTQTMLTYYGGDRVCERERTRLVDLFVRAWQPYVCAGWGACLGSSARSAHTMKMGRGKGEGMVVKHAYLVHFAMVWGAIEISAARWRMWGYLLEMEREIFTTLLHSKTN